MSVYLLNYTKIYNGLKNIKLWCHMYLVHLICSCVNEKSKLIELFYDSIVFCKNYLTYNMFISIYYVVYGSKYEHRTKKILKFILICRYIGSLLVSKNKLILFFVDIRHGAAQQINGQINNIRDEQRRKK